MTAGQADDEGPIRIGLSVPEGVEVGHVGSIPPPSTSAPAVPGAPTLRARLDRFCEALAGAVGRPVTAFGLAHYRELLDAMHEGRLDVAWLPPIIALKATARGRTLPIAIPVRGGASTFSSALFSRAGSPLRKTSDLVGVRAAWVDRQSAAGYLVIRASLRAQGFELGRCFASEAFLGSHEAVVEAVQSGAADVGATYVHLDAAHGDAVVSAGWGTHSPQIIAYGGPIPNDVVAASIRVPVTTIRAVQRALCGGGDAALGQAAAELMSAEGFVAPAPEHLDPLGRLLEYLDDLHNQSAFPPPPR